MEGSGSTVLPDCFTSLSFFNLLFSQALRPGKKMSTSSGTVGFELSTGLGPLYSELDSLSSHSKLESIFDFKSASFSACSSSAFKLGLFSSIGRGLRPSLRAGFLTRGLRP